MAATHPLPLGCQSVGRRDKAPLCLPDHPGGRRDVVAHLVVGRFMTTSWGAAAALSAPDRVTTLQLLGWSVLGVAIAATVLMVLAGAVTRVSHKRWRKLLGHQRVRPDRFQAARDAEVDEARSLLRDRGLPDEEIERRIEALVAFNAATAGYYLPAIPTAARNAPRRDKAS